MSRIRETRLVLLAGAEANRPQDRIHALAYDKVANTNDVHELLHGKAHPADGLDPLAAPTIETAH